MNHNQNASTQKYYIKLSLGYVHEVYMNYEWILYRDMYLIYLFSLDMGKILLGKIPDVKHFTPQVVIERFNILLQVIVGMYTIDFSI